MLAYSIVPDKRTHKVLSSNTDMISSRDIYGLCFTIARKGNATHLVKFIAAMLAVEVV
jgi:hypothetical protein